MLQNEPLSSRDQRRYKLTFFAVMADLIQFVDDIDVAEILNIVEDNEDIQSYFDDDEQRIMKIYIMHSLDSVRALALGLMA